MSIELKIFIGIVSLIAAGVIYIKYFKKEPVDPEEEIDPIEPPKKPTDPLPPVEPEKPDPVKPKPPKKSFDIDFSPNSTEDQTEYILEQMRAFPSGSAGSRNTMRFKDGIVIVNGDTTRFKYGYGENGIFKLYDKHHFNIEGNTVFKTTEVAAPLGGSVDKHTYSHRRHFWLHNFSNFRIEGITIIGMGEIDPTPNLKGLFPKYISYRAFEHGLDLQDCEDVEIVNVKTSLTSGDGIYFGGVSKNIKVIGVHLAQAGRQGIASGGSIDGLLIDGVFIDHCARSATDWETDHETSTIQNIEVKNSKLFGRFTAMAALGRGTVRDIYYHDNEYQGTTIRFKGNPDLPKRENLRWEKNTAVRGYGSPVAPVQIFNTNNIIYKDNIDPITHTQSDIGMELKNCGGVINIQGNNFKNPEAKTIVWGGSDTSQLTYENNKPNLINIRND